MAATPLRAQSLTTGVMRPSGRATARPMSIDARSRMVVALPARVDVGVADYGLGGELDEEGVERKRLLAPGVGRLAQGQEGGRRRRGA